MKTRSKTRPATWLAHALIILVAAYCGLVCGEEKAYAPTQPSRHELWVPNDALDTVLQKHPHAVLLDRAQYEALIRDAGKPSADAAEKPPVPCAVSGVKLRVELAAEASSALITATLSVHPLVATWSEVNLLDLPPGVVPTRFEGESIVTASSTKGGPALRLMVRGPGKRDIVMEFRSPIQRTNGVCHALVPYLARPFSISAVPVGKVTLPASWPVQDGVARVPLFDERMNATGTSFYWAEGIAATQPTLLERADGIAHVRAAEIETFHRVTVDSIGGPLPSRLRFVFADAATQVTRVGWWGAGEPPASRNAQVKPVFGGREHVVAWRQDGPTLELTRPENFATQAEFFFATTKPSPLTGSSAELTLDVPRLEGAARVSANLAVRFRDGVEMAGWRTPGTTPPQDFLDFEKRQRDANHADAASFHTHYDAAPAALAVGIRRVGDRFSTDVDLHALITQHHLELTRTVTLRGEEGRVARTTVTLPEGEQFLSLEVASGESVEWKQVAANAGNRTSLEFTWPSALDKNEQTTVTLRTRQDLAGNAETPSPTLHLQNLAVPEATRLAGYVALDFDESWKVATPEATGLETRDARLTPVKGRMAWFHLRDYRLAIQLARHEPVLDATVTAYALPRARTVEIEGQVSVEVTRAPLRSFTVKLPPATAALLRWDAPLIGERVLDAASGTWTLSLRQELLGVAHLRWHLSLPAGAAGDSETATGVLAATLPTFALPTARRFAGTWIVEANTDTELSFSTKGLQPLDALRAPRVEGYTPRHRVLAAYAYGSAPHELRVTATRHDSTRLVSAVVETLALTSVLARDGTARHQAELRVRHSGDQFFAVRLPEGAMLLSTSVELEAVKPVTAGKDEVRVPLPRGHGGQGLARVTVHYETKGEPWSSSGHAALPPPTFDPSVPVLTTAWRVYAPDGMSYVDPETTLVNAWRLQGNDCLTACILDAGGNLLEVYHPWVATSRFIERAFDVLGTSGVGDPAPIAAEARAAYAERAGLKVTDRADGMIEITPEYPKPMFMGTPVPLSTAALPSGPIPQAAQPTPNEIPHAAPAKPAASYDALSLAMEDASLKKERSTAKSGLLPVQFQIPTAGRFFEFRGNQMPELLVMRYETWERQIALACLWLFAGLALFWSWGRGRPWWRTLGAALLLTCVPMALLPTWLTVCNALLAGWLLGFGIWLLQALARRLEVTGTERSTLA